MFLTSDFLTTNSQEQTNNNIWLKDLLNNAILKSSNQELKIFKSIDTTSTNLFSRYEFFIKSNIILDLSNKHFLFKADDISDDSLEYLSSFLQSKFLISYELSNETKIILNKINIEYLDIWLNPIRFFDDILFSFYSNNKYIYNDLIKYQINNELFYNSATLIKIQTYKGWNRKKIPIEKNSVVFFGQTKIDKAVSHNCNFLNILNFKKEVLEIKSKYNNMYYIKHPHVKKIDEQIISFLQTNKIKIIDYPAYYILSHENITEIISISSSLLEESKYFNKKITYLHKPIIELGNNFENEEYITIFQDFISSYFWSDILKHKFDINIIKNKTTFIYTKDKLRNALSFYWSYNQIDKEEFFRLQTIKNKTNTLQKIFHLIKKVFK